MSGSNASYPLACLLLALPIFLQAQDTPDAITGRWMDEDSTTVMEIYETNGLYDGRIIWLADSLDERGEPVRDVHNTNPDLRGRTLIGIDLIYGFQWMDGKWRKGKVYDQHSGRTYNGKITLRDGELRLSGYYGIFSFLGKTRRWTRSTEHP